MLLKGLIDYSKNLCLTEGVGMGGQEGRQVCLYQQGSSKHHQVQLILNEPT